MKGKKNKKGITINLTPYMGKGIEFDEFKPKNDEERIIEQEKHGVYFEDNYNYLQHLKCSNSFDPDLIDIMHIPVDQGFLEKVLKEKDISNFIDNDIKEVLEADHIENDLEDDFIIKASSNNLHKSLDKKKDEFDLFYETYDSFEIGSLSEGEIDNNMNTEGLNLNLYSPIKSKKWENIDIPKDSPHFQKYLYIEMENNDEESIEEFSDISESDQDDVESILTHKNSKQINPILIADPFKPRFPNLSSKDVSSITTAQLLSTSFKQNLKIGGPLKAQPMDEASSYISSTMTCILKDRDENKERKRNVKEERRKRREEKKINRLTFKKEICKDHVQRINSQLNHQAAIKLS